MENIVFRRGRQVILRPVERRDIPTMRGWMNDPEVTEYIARVFPLYEKEEEEWFEKLHQNHDLFVFAIISVENGEIIGTIGLCNIHWVNQTATTGTCIGNTKYWGKGFGTEAKMLLLEYAFNTLGFLVIQSKVLSFNGRSLSYAKKCGYQEVGRIPEWHRGKDGKRYDEVILIVTPEWWQPLWERYQKKNRA